MTKKKPSSSSLTECSPITSIAVKLFSFIKWLSPMQWISRFFPIYRPRSELTQEEIQSEDFINRRGPSIENYMIGWLIIEILLVILSCIVTWPNWIKIIFGVVVASRIIEIIQVAVNTTLLDALSGRPDERVSSIIRIIVLTGVNFIELLLCFGVIYATNYMSLSGAGKAITGFYFSIITQLTIGYGDVYPTGWLRIVAAVQGLIGIVFIILVFGRVMASFPQMHDVSRENGNKGSPTRRSSRRGKARRKIV